MSHVSHPTVMLTQLCLITGPLPKESATILYLTTHPPLHPLLLKATPAMAHIIFYAILAPIVLKDS